MKRIVLPDSDHVKKDGRECDDDYPQLRVWNCVDN